MNYSEFNQNHPKGHIMQSELWHKVKDNWKHDVVEARDENGELTGFVSVLIRKLPVVPLTMMYAPRGPVCDVHDEKTLRQLTDGLKKLAKKHHSYVLKIDPDVECDDTEFVEIMKKLGYSLKDAGKNFDGVQPRFVFRLDVKDKTEDEIFAAFHSKTRYNIRVALKHGVEVRRGNRDDLKRFHEIMLETGLRDGFIIRSQSYFEKMYDALEPTGNLRLYCAYSGEKMIAATIALYYGDKVWYLYGASSNEARNLMPNYLLQWEMIKWAIEEKCAIYDFRGVSGDLSEDNPLYGLYRFKKGFSGKLTEFVGEFEYQFSPFLAKFIEKASRFYMKLRRKLFLKRKK